MNLKNFELERYFAKHEFAAKYLLSSSDCDGYELSYLLDIASTKEKSLWENLTLGYTESSGHPFLRESILKYYNINSIENVVVASPGELNFISMNLLLQKGDHVISITPSYQSLYEIAKSLDCEVSFWEPNKETWEFDTQKIISLIKNNTKLIILNFPHNPTGAYLSIHQLNEIVEIARERGIYIFSDEMYHKLNLSLREELPPVANLYEKGISLWGTSKTFGLVGVRTGWLVSQDVGFINSVIAFKDYLSICNSAPSEILSIIALNNIDKLVVPNIKKINTNITIFRDSASKWSKFLSFIPPKAGSCGFVNLKISESSISFSDRLVEETGIMTVPAEMFGFEGSYIRLGFGRRNFPKVIERLDEYFDIRSKLGN